MKKQVLLVVGPTGVGKTDLSISLAERLDAEIVSADSRQIYKYMDIGTAKPSKTQLSAVPHHFIDIKKPDEYYSAGQYGNDARQCIDEIFARRKQPMVVGGSGLYIRALVDGLFEPKIADREIKIQLQSEVNTKGIAVLYDRLRQLDPATAARLHSTDTQRILRALEVQQIAGRPFSEFLQTKPKPADFAPVFVGLTRERQHLYARIDARVDDMLAMGLLAEVRKLQALGYSPDLNALQTVGYKEAFLHLAGKLTFEEMADLIKQKTRNYAKRQLTWFRKDRRIRWLNLDEFDQTPALVEHVCDLFSGKTY